ncbi:MAG: hypothetical protein U1F25_17325 [Rubrivivax sp.]
MRSRCAGRGSSRRWRCSPWRRAAHHRGTATAATAGVVASLALSVALTVMVASFRTSVTDWLDQVLPADLYARSAATATMAETAWLPSGFEAQVQSLPGVQRVAAARACARSNSSRAGPRWR